MRIIPSLELKELYYAKKHAWIYALLKVTDTILIRPEKEVAKAYGYRLSLNDYLKKFYHIDARFKFIMDHGIFVTPKQFREFFHLDKTPETVLKVYDVLKVDYGLAYDIPARLHLEVALSPAKQKLKRGIHPALRKQVELISFLKDDKIRAEEEIRTLSLMAVEETLKNLKTQLEIKHKRGYTFTLIPSVQGLYKEHAVNCLKESIDLLLSYDEKDLYLAIGTGGTRLKEEDVKLINDLLVFGHEYAKKHEVSIKFHLLGFSSAPILKKLRVDLIHSADAVTVLRRAVEKKVYIIRNNDLKLVPVKDIDKEKWSCTCPACNNFKHLVLQDASTREAHVRFVHNLAILNEYFKVQ